MTMNEREPIDPRLQRALHDVMQSEADLGASVSVQARLQSAVRQRSTARQRHRQIAWVAAAAAIVIVVSGARWYFAPGPAALQRPQQAQVDAPSSTDAVPVDFLPLPYANVPTSNGQIVQIVLPASAMASFGLDPSSAGGDAVNADVFVGEDGLARGIRFSPFTAKELVP